VSEWVITLLPKLLPDVFT